jgi:hypothetical protein
MKRPRIKRALTSFSRENAADVRLAALSFKAQLYRNLLSGPLSPSEATDSTSKYLAAARFQRGRMHRFMVNLQTAFIFKGILRMQKSGRSVQKTA